MSKRQIDLPNPPAVLYFHNGMALSPYGDEVCPWPHPDGWFVIVTTKRFTNGRGHAYQFGPFSTFEEAEARACEIDSMRDSKNPIFEDDKGELSCDATKQYNSSGELVDPSERNKHMN